MGYVRHYVSSPRYCFSTEDYNECINKHYHITDDSDEKNFPKWFFV